MKIGGAYQLPVARERAYPMMQDPRVLERCMPGCDRLDKTGDNEYAMRMKMALASMSGLFDGTVRIADPKPPSSFRLIVEGKGKIGFMKGEGLITLAANEASTDVTYDGEVSVGGTIAAVGQRLLDATAKLVIKRFFDKLAQSAAIEDASSTSA
jgi:carbon monoxide dehydrogenase subunit G